MVFKPLGTTVEAPSEQKWSRLLKTFKGENYFKINNSDLVRFLALENACMGVFPDYISKGYFEFDFIFLCLRYCSKVRYRSGQTDQVSGNFN